MIVFKGKLLEAGKAIQTEFKGFAKPEIFVCDQWQAKKGGSVLQDGLMQNSRLPILAWHCAELKRSAEKLGFLSWITILD